MATRIVAPTPDSSCATDAPDLDSVVLWLTLTIERDYIERGVFRAYRAETAAASRANATLHYLTCDQAQALLDDAEARRFDAYKSLKVAFNAHAANLRSALDEAKGRRAKFEATEPVCTYRSEWSENWRGTKEQLKSIGVALDGPYPGEQGGKERWAQTRDQRGYKVRITRASTTWAGLFLADIEVPEDVRKKMQEAKKEADAEKERLQRLKTMPATADKFREDVAKTFWMFASATKAQMQAKDGYRFTDEVVEEFMDAVSEAYWSIKNGQTAGRSPREKLQQVMCAKAKSDKSLQRFLSSFRPDAAH
jgi:hypothetical protein